MTEVKPVPDYVWNLLKVDRTKFRPQWWASMTQPARAELLKLAKSQAQPSNNWRAIPAEDRAAILKLLTKVRQIYVLTNLETEWHRIAGGVDE